MNDESALTNLGTHLLGRKPLPPDPRDYQLADYLTAHAKTGTITPETTLQEVHDTFPLSVWHDVYAFWAAFKKLFTNPTPSPTPTPAPTSADWKDPESVLDQGQTGHCVGFCGAQWGNTLPVDDHYVNQDGHKLYYECKVIDGEPGAEDGSNSRSLCKALKARGRISAYAFTTDAKVVAAFVSQHGPVGVGTDWLQSMFTPQLDHYLRVTGAVAGGHEWLIVGYSEAGYGDNHVPSFEMQNSWGAGWGNGGRAYITEADLQMLLTNGGDAWAGLELAA